MAYDLKTINEKLRTDPKAYVAQCDLAYQEKIDTAIEKVCGNMENSPVVLLSGPSGSGKTTSALKIEEGMKKRGIKTYTVSMDDYYKTVNPLTVPRTPEGDIDYESPDCIDMELLDEHFTLLEQHKEIQIPHFIFSRQKRSASRFTPLKLGKNEIAIFEGIHALNDSITDKHPNAFKLYVSARSNITDGGEMLFKGTWMRLVRRVVRDNNFRGADAAFTLQLWGNVRRGEKLHISPFKHKADFMLDSSLPYEVSLMKTFAMPLFENIPDGTERTNELTHIIPAFERFANLDQSFVQPESLLREFIGGGIYKY